ncbi:hypothetical protein ACFQL7_25995 [Halocatena marina]|uniref:Uncharacterized protein n=1 Tax=Halocatena marina TaxID=2934937 RepID=A0ABD5YUZ3_9EURY|nr:hypothetical protein [Halocatena marina]
MFYAIENATEWPLNGQYTHVDEVNSKYDGLRCDHAVLKLACVDALVSSNSLTMSSTRIRQHQFLP